LFTCWRMSALKKTKKIGTKVLGKIFFDLPFKVEQGSDDDRLMKLHLEDVDAQATVKEVKILIEKDLGIVRDLYHLSYLDDAPLQETGKLSDHDVVEKASLRIKVWKLWSKLLSAALLGEISNCFSTSIDITGSTDWSKCCAWTTLYVAAHCGHHNLVAELLRRTQLAVNKKTESGWTALHAAARMGRWKVLCMLVDNGAHVKIEGNEGETAFDLARKYKHKKCENSLNFCQWNLQKHRIVQERKLDYDAANDRRSCSRQGFQTVDSTHKISFRGPRLQLYQPHIANPVGMPKVKTFEKERPKIEQHKVQLQVKLREEEKESEAGGKLDFAYGWFDGLRAQQLIPSTHDIIRYSDPSSCQLWPRSLVNPGGYKTSRHVNRSSTKTDSRPALKIQSISELVNYLKKEKLANSQDTSTSSQHTN